MSAGTLSVAEAKACIRTAVARGPAGRVPLAAAVGRVLAAAPRAVVDNPPFDNAAMDGFAIDHRTTGGAMGAAPVRLPIAGAQFAGRVEYAILPPGETVRIATGAKLPKGTTAVIEQEAVTEAEGTIVIGAPVAEGRHIRRRAEEIAAGATAFPAWTVGTPAALGFLAEIGISEVEVMLPPRVTILPTGTELVPLGGSLRNGRRYESNSVALDAALAEFAITADIVPPVPDRPEAQRTAIAAALEQSDCVLITGGLSVGKADYVRGLLAELDVKMIFWGVRQKPGKPLYFGRRGRRLVFGLPGNPVSALVCYYEYVRPAIRHWMGFAETELPSAQAILAEPIQKAPGRCHFLRAQTWTDNGQLRTRPTGAQESHRMQPFALANALIVVPEELAGCPVGAPVTVHWLPSTPSAP